MKTCPKCGKEYQDATTLCPTDGTVLKKAGDDLIGQTLIGKYRIEERLDEGGMGTVYRATHTLMEKIVAIKVLHPSLAADDKIVARFTREAKAASRISHPHALTVTDFGESENGIVFLVMEYLRGQTLKEVVRSEGRMPLARVVEIIRQVCGALEAAHGEGVVHRDLKSDNIMLEETNGGDWSKVLDFGIAKIQEPDGAIDPGLTAPNLIIGTPQYMSPEQCSQASEIDARSDIYSLGVIIYELLAGHVPFTGDSPTAIMMKHLQEAPPSILEERQDLPAAVGRVISRSLSKRPEDRFQNAAELSDALTLASTGDSLETVAIAGTTDTAQHDDPHRDTNRIVVPTGPNEAPRRTANEDYDEATVVRTPTPTELEAVSIISTTPAPPVAASFNPWRIAVPALALLVIVFAVVYALQLNSGPSSAEEQAAPLTVDPNGQAVQSASPATGESESNITPTNPTTDVTPSLDTGLTVTPTTTRSTNEAQTQPSPADATNNNTGETEQANDNTDAEANTEATPTPTPRVRRVPPSLQVTPTPNASDDDDAPPMKKPPAASPTPPVAPAVTETKDNDDDVPSPSKS